MRLLGSLALLLLLVAAPWAGALALAAPPPERLTAPGDWDGFLARYDRLGRMDLAGVVPVSFDLPLGADGALHVAVSWRDGIVGPAPAGASAAPAAGCVTVGGVSPDLPWALQVPAPGPCPHPGALHAWGIHTTVMTCLGAGGVCFTDGVGHSPAGPGGFVVVCSTPQAASVAWLVGAPWSVPTAQCGLFAAGSSPPQWQAWDSVCAHAFGASGVYSCAHQGA